jgi:hypothetical protein
MRESVYLTVRTTAMVCWLFVGSYTFSAVFSYLGGEHVISEFVKSLNLSPIMFLILAQLIIFLLGWPLEWSEIIIIFVPIFLPLLAVFEIDPLFFGILVALNLQTSFLTPPMAMSAYYLKGIAPPELRLTQIFAGVMPFLFCVILSMVLMYVFPQIVFYLPEVFYGRGAKDDRSGSTWRDRTAGPLGERRAGRAGAGRKLHRADRSARGSRGRLGVVRSRVRPRAGPDARQLSSGGPTAWAVARAASGPERRDRHPQHPD